MKLDSNIKRVCYKDFMENDENPILKDLSDKLLKDPEFQRILKQSGYKNPDEEKE